MDARDRERKLKDIFQKQVWMIDTLLSPEDEDMFLGIHPSGHNYDPKDFPEIIELLKKESIKRISGKKC